MAGSLSRTWLVLPGEGYLQAAYGPDGSDELGLHAFAAERAVMLVGPSGLRSTLQLATLWQSEAAAGARPGRQAYRISGKHAPSLNRMTAVCSARTPEGAVILARLRQLVRSQPAAVYEQA